MELRLVLDTNRTCNGEGKLACVRKLRFHTKTIQGRDFFFDLFTVAERIDVRVFSFKIAVDVFAKLGI